VRLEREVVAVHALPHGLVVRLADVEESVACRMQVSIQAHVGVPEGMAIAV
jgi:hypothetical protein